MLTLEAVDPLHAPESDLAVPRQVARTLQLAHHREGFHVANLTGDAELMLRDGEFYGLVDRDMRRLKHILRACILVADNLEGAEVVMNSSQWKHFVTMRRTFIRFRRDPRNLSALLRARSAIATTPSIS